MKNFYNQNKLKNAGFTLIELLVVIAIIGLFSSVILATVNSARVKARDTRRISDLKQIQRALEFYYNDNKQYPLSAGGVGVWGGHCPVYGDFEKYIVGMEPYMPVLPKDPLFDSGPQCYLYRSDGTDYMLIAHFTMETIIGGDPSAAGNPSYIQTLDRPGGGAQPTIAVYTSGARNW